jgi:FMN phosphatase YigB (HAD superfamily)
MNCILFDWGDTLMRVFPEYDGAMADWPQVEALPGALETLAVLHPSYTLAVATNAQNSDEGEIWRALRRVGLANQLDKVYCFRSIGYLKPSKEFFAYILADLRLSTDAVIMVGDDWESDIVGANRAGLRAVWLNEQNGRETNYDRVQTIHSLLDLTGALQRWDPI